MVLTLPQIPETASPYLANMRALWKMAPRFAQQIDLISPNELIPCQPARQGDLTCQVPGPAGPSVYLHSRYDPRKEAATWVEGVLNNCGLPIADCGLNKLPKPEVKLPPGIQIIHSEEKDSSIQNPKSKIQNSESEISNTKFPMCYVVDGFGLGYHIQALFDRLAGDAFIVVGEPDLVLFRTALEHFDYSAMLESGRLLLVTRAERDEIFQRLQDKGNLMMLGVVFTKPLQRLHPEFHQAVHTLVNQYAAFIRTHLLTLLGNGLRTCDNIIDNLPAYVTCPPVNLLKGKFGGCPAVIVSAGPSLQRNIDQLKLIRDRVVVIAVQTTLKPLLARGIRPDFVTSLDYHDISRRFFEGVEHELHNICLVAEPKASAAVIEFYRQHGPVILSGNDLLRLVARDMGDGHDLLPAGTTVAHLSFYLAQYLGADPIIFLGQDLGFTDNVYYSPGTALHATWQGELNRFSTLEMKEWERIVRHRQLLRKVPDIQGGWIYTDEQMFTYLQQFEKDFAHTTVRVIDASEGGTRKQNCLTLPLAQAAEQFCRAPLDPARFAWRDSLHLTPEKQAEARTCLENRLRETEEMGEIIRETVAVVREMLTLIDDQPRLNQKMVRLDELRTMVKHRDEAYRLIMYVAQMAELYRFRQDRTIKASGVEGKDLQRQQLTRDLGYLTELEKGAARMITLLHRGLKKLKSEAEPRSHEDTKKQGKEKQSV